MYECANQSEYDDDPRTACIFGVKCYQKNSPHRQKYKHPPKISSEDSKIKHVNKKLKLDSDAGVSMKAECSPDTKNKDVTTDFNNDTGEQSISDNKRRRVEEADVRSDSVEPEKEDATSRDEEVASKDFSLLSDKDFIKKRFLVKMPKDFYSFWELCTTMNRSDPSIAFKDCQLLLVGPFDVLAKKIKNCKKSSNEFLRHWRYYYDPPEFQTVIKGDDKTGYHIGYYRDSPDDDPVFVASNNCCLDDCEIHPIAENIFGAVNAYLESYKKKCDPFKKLKVSKLCTQLVGWATKHSFTLEQNTTKMRNRNTKIVAKTFNRAGIVVPYDRRTQVGYRTLIETDPAIKKLLKKITDAENENERDESMSELQPIITMANIAVDECDFGTGLELGLDLFADGNKIFHPIVSSLLISTYDLLNRNAFSRIIQAHLEDRKKGTNLSILD